MRARRRRPGAGSRHERGAGSGRRWPLLPAQGDPHRRRGRLGLPVRRRGRQKALRLARHQGRRRRPRQGRRRRRDRPRARRARDRGRAGARAGLRQQRPSQHGERRRPRDAADHCRRSRPAPTPTQSSTSRSAGRSTRSITRGHSVTVFAADTGKVRATIPLPGVGEFAVLDAERGQVFVNVEDTSQLVAIDTASHQVTATWPLAPGEEPTGLAFDPRSPPPVRGLRQRKARDDRRRHGQGARERADRGRSGRRGLRSGNRPRLRLEQRRHADRCAAAGRHAERRADPEHAEAVADDDARPEDAPALRRGGGVRAARRRVPTAGRNARRSRPARSGSWCTRWSAPPDAEISRSWPAPEAFREDPGRLERSPFSRSSPALAATRTRKSRRSRSSRRSISRSRGTSTWRRRAGAARCGRPRCNRRASTRIPTWSSSRRRTRRTGCSRSTSRSSPGSARPASTSPASSSRSRTWTTPPRSRRCVAACGWPSTACSPPTRPTRSPAPWSRWPSACTRWRRRASRKAPPRAST